MDTLIQQIVSGLATGGIYGSVALALVMIYQATEVVNYAQGEMAMFSTYLAWTLLNAGVPYWIAFGATLVIAFVGGLLLERILIREGARVDVVPVDGIDYIEAQDDYVLVRSGGKQFMKHDTLANLEAQLDPQRFVRIHRSYLLHVARLARVEPYAKDSRIAILQDGTKLPVSRTGYARLSELL